MPVDLVVCVQVTRTVTSEDLKFNKFRFTHDAAAAVAATAAGKLESRGDALSETTVALRLAARSSLTFSEDREQTYVNSLAVVNLSS